jgi:hypothetical protein
MAPLTKNLSGDMGENLVAVDFSRPVKGRYKRPLFRPKFLGDKYPTIDLIIDVLAPDSETRLGFFFVQIKAIQGCALSAPRLPIKVPQLKFNDLVDIQAPTYLVGVDIDSETTYLVGAYGRRSLGVSSISKNFKLKDDNVRIDLYKEVLEYWKVNSPTVKSKKFNDV